MTLKLLRRIIFSLVFLFHSPADATGRPHVPSREAHFDISLTEEWKIKAVLRVPLETSGKKLPVVMIFGGFEEAGDVLGLIHPREPVILASFDYPYLGSRKFEFPGILGELGKFREGIRLTHLGISKLLTQIKSRSDVDSERIAIVGASFGAPFAIRAAADHADIRALVIVHGFGDIRGTVRHRLSQVFAPRLGKVAELAASVASEILVIILNPPVPERDALKLRTSQNALMIEAVNDEFIPQHSRTLLWNSLRGSKAHIKHIPMAGGHLQPGAHGLIDDLIGITVDWLRELRWFSPQK